VTSAITARQLDRRTQPGPPPALGGCRSPQTGSSTASNGVCERPNPGSRGRGSESAATWWRRDGRPAPATCVCGIRSANVLGSGARKARGRQCAAALSVTAIVSAGGHETLPRTTCESATRRRSGGVHARRGPRRIPTGRNSNMGRCRNARRPTHPAGTASSSASSARSTANRRTAASGPTAPPATAPCHRSCASTTDGARTPPPAADRHHARPARPRAGHLARQIFEPLLGELALE
jgi:hypothetical protein